MRINTNNDDKKDKGNKIKDCLKLQIECTEANYAQDANGQYDDWDTPPHIAQ